MGKPQKKAPATDTSKHATGLSLDLGLNIGKKPRGATAQLQPKKLVDSKGNTTIEGLKQNLESMVSDLLSKIDKNAATAVSKVAEAEAVVHKQAKADHARTCQVLQDSQAAMDLASQQHQAALKQVQQVGRATAAAIDGIHKSTKEHFQAARGNFERDFAALRSKAGIK